MKDQFKRKIMNNVLNCKVSALNIHLENNDIKNIHNTLISIVDLNKLAWENNEFNPDLSSVFQDYSTYNNHSFAGILAYVIRKSENRNKYIKIYLDKYKEQLLKHY